MVSEVLHKVHPMVYPMVHPMVHLRGAPLINNAAAGTGREATKNGVDRRAMHPARTRETTAMNGVIGMIVKATVRK